MCHLETSRLNLIPFKREEIHKFLQINRHPAVRQYLWDNDKISKEQAEEILATNQQYLEENHFGLWKIQRKEHPQVMGYSGLWYFFGEDQPQLIYALLPDFWGRGWATEAAVTVMRYAFDRLKFSYLVASMDDGHQQSEKVARRIGMSLWKKQCIKNKSTAFYRISAP